MLDMEEQRPPAEINATCTADEGLAGSSRIRTSQISEEEWGAFRWITSFVFGRSRPDANSTVSGIADAYIGRCHRQNESALAEELEKSLNDFKKIRFKSPNELLFHAVEYSDGYVSEHQNGNPDRMNYGTIVDCLEITNFASFIEVLSDRNLHRNSRSTRLSCELCQPCQQNQVKKRLLYLDLGKDAFLSSLGFVTRYYISEENLREQHASFSKIVKILVSSYQNVAPKEFRQLWSVPPRFSSVLQIPLPPQEHHDNTTSATSLPSSPKHIQITSTSILYPYWSNLSTGLLEPHSRLPEFKTLHIVESICGEQGDDRRVEYDDVRTSMIETDLSFAKFYSRLREGGSPATTSKTSISGSSIFPIEVSHWHLKPQLECDALPLKPAVQEVIDNLSSNYRLVSHAVNSQQIDGRKSPSQTRLKYLFYLTECLTFMEEDIKHVEVALNTASGDQHLNNWVEMNRKYLTELSKASIDLRARIDAAERMIRKLLEARLSYWTTVFGLGGAIYIALSFTTGIYGMNIHEINEGKPRWWSVVITGISSTILTVILPLTIGYILRTFLRIRKSRLGQATVVTMTAVSLYFLIGSILLLLLPFWITVFVFGYIKIKQHIATRPKTSVTFLE